MLVEAGIFDSYGVGREYAPAAEVLANNDGVTYVQHRKWKDLTPGRYSDDTQMAVGLSDFMLSRKAPTAPNLWTHFLHAYKRDPRAGYAGKFYEILKKVNNIDEMMRTIQPQSDRSGGAMRAAPCGLLPTVKEAIDMAFWQASLTHATRDGLSAAGAAAALTWACRHDVDRGYLPQFLDDVLPGFRWSTPWTGPVGAPGLEAVKAALAAVVDHGDLHAILKASIAFTGDVDTVAAIAGAAASLHPGVEKNLPRCLYDNLEPTGKYGLDFLKTLDDKLLAAFPLVTGTPEDDEPQPPGEVVPLVEEASSDDLFDLLKSQP